MPGTQKNTLSKKLKLDNVCYITIVSRTQNNTVNTKLKLKIKSTGGIPYLDLFATSLICDIRSPGLGFLLDSQPFCGGNSEEHIEYEAKTQ